MLPMSGAIFFSLILSTLSPNLQQAEPEKTDSVNTLDEIVVEGRNQTTSPTVTVYVPEKKAKKAAHDAADLLTRMAIPQLSISPDGKISTTVGDGLAIFINYMPAEDFDLKGLRVSDVIRVEYLDYTTDPRFNGVSHAVNFIVEEYERGGYTKLWNFTTFDNKVSTSSSAFQRYVAGKFTTDLFASYTYQNRTHTGSNVHEAYSLIDDKGNPITATRELQYKDSKNITTYVPVSLRISYNTDKLTIRNTFGYTFLTRPVKRSSGLMHISGVGNEAGYEYAQSSPDHNNSISWTGSVYADLTKGWSLDFYNSLVYTHTDRYSHYLSGYEASPIVNNAKEKAYNYDGQLSFQKQFTDNHILTLDFSGKISYNHIDYTGSDPFTERYSSPSYAAKATYNYRNSKLSLSATAGLFHEQFRVNGIKRHSTNPHALLNLSYSYDQSNSSSLSVQYTNASPVASVIAPYTYRENEFLYVSGNPDLKTYDQFWATISHLWLPSQKVNASVFAQYMGYYDRIIPIYSHYPGRPEAVLSKFENDGNFHTVVYGLNFTLRLFSGKLLLNAQPRQAIFISTGSCQKTYSPFMLTTYGYYYFGNFTAGVYFVSPRTSVPLDRSWHIKNVSYTRFYLSWSNDALTASASIQNPWRKSYKFSTKEITGGVFNSFATNYSPEYNRSVSISVSYTIGYGSKVNRWNEIGDQGSASSAILTQ